MHTRRDADLDLDVEQRLASRLSGGLLERVAVTLTATLDLKEVLGRLAEMGREASGANRCSILLLEDDRLRPAASSTAEPEAGDDVLWEAFRRMPPIHLTDEQWELLRDGKGIAFGDARDTSFIPPEWVERFSLRAVAVVPLLSHGRPCGVMAVDWPEVHEIPDSDLRLLESIGAYAGIAVHNARLHQRMASKTRTLEHIVSVASSLNGSSSLERILEQVCVAYEQVLATTHCSVNLTDPADPLHMHMLASRGERWFHRGGTPLTPEELLPTEEIRRASSGPVVYPNVGTDDEEVEAPASVRSAALFPLFGPDGVVGAVVAGFPTGDGPGEAELEAGQTLAELAATAIGRADLHGQLQRRIRQLELLSHLSEVVTGKATLDDVLAGVNDALAPELATRFEALLVPDGEVRSVVGAAEPDGDEAAVIARWEDGLASGIDRIDLSAVDGKLLVPVTHHRHVFGALRVGVTGGQVSLSDEEFLLAVGGAFAEVVHRSMLDRALGEGERRIAVIAERERIARDLHDSAGQALTGMGAKLASYLEDAPNETWRYRLTTLLQLARDSERELREGIDSLVFVDAGEEGLARSLHELAGRFSATTGIEVSVRVEGDPVALSAEEEDALFRVAHEALGNAERHARASAVRVVLGFDADAASLVVEDDGVGFPGGEPPAGGLRFGLRGIERRLGEVDGALVVGPAESGGARVEACLPADNRG